jgi:pyrroloquinoline quinone biosynthesis protein B
MTLRFTAVILSLLLFSCDKKAVKQSQKINTNPFVVILGVAQDAGYPQANSDLPIDSRTYKHPEYRRMVVSLGLVDPISNETWLFDATPNFTYQLQVIKDNTPKFEKLSGIFLTHAHIGHYTGLMYLGREAMGAKNTIVYAMPRMLDLLKTNQPWKQLATLQNIKLVLLKKDSSVILNERLKITPIQVPHRDELSETVGYIINGPNKKLLFIPDINKWQVWKRDIKEYIRKVDYAFLDGSFFTEGEIKNRPMSEIPHPFVTESMVLFKDLPISDKRKIYFIHFNHTNPLLIDGGKAQKQVKQKGFNMAVELQKIEL